MLREKIKPRYNRTTLSPQYCKLVKNIDVTAKEWMGHFRIKTTDCKYQEDDRRFKEQFINGMNDKTVISEIIKEFVAIKNTIEVTSEQVLALTRRTGAER